MAAATVNGTLTPPPANELKTNDVADAGLSNKRKREDEVVDEASFDNDTSPEARIQRDVLEFLSRHDTEPSFLQHSLRDTRPTSSDQPSHKKPRLSETPSDHTIALKLRTGSYQSISELKEDAARVSQALSASLRLSSDEEGLHGRVPVDKLKQIQRIKAYEQLLKDVADRESSYEAAHKGQPDKIQDESSTLSNGSPPHLQGPLQGRDSTVLTLFGNAPTPKQLFSSLQHAPANIRDGLIKTELPVDEMSLPNGLSATKVMAVPRQTLKTGPTFSETFAPPSTLPQMQPPKPQKRTAARENSITWEFKEPSTRNSKRGGYTTQTLSTSDWLSYGGMDYNDDPASPGQKRRKRDRALSGTVFEDSPILQNANDTLEKEEEALFRRAFSSFAPSCDNTRALVPAETKSMVWWHKVGSKRYNEVFAVDPELIDEPFATGVEEHQEASGNEVPLDDDEMDRIMQDLETSESFPVEAAERSATNVDEVLQRVSELLETLAAYQRIRNAALPSSNTVRTPASPALASVDLIVGKPDMPVVYEKETYSSLKRELAYLVMKLPPYAVAKLDGDQLAELGVSRLIQVDNEHMKGTLEEDQASRHAKYVALTAASGIASLQRSASSSNPHYSSTNQRAPAIGQAANTRYGQTPQFNSRTPAPTYQRFGGAQTNYGASGTTASRPSFSQPDRDPYMRQLDLLAKGPPKPPTYFQRDDTYQQRLQQMPPKYGGPSEQSRAPFMQPPPQYQQRSQSTTANATSYQQNRSTYQAHQAANYGRTVSPANPTSYSPAPPNVAATTPRQSYATQQYPGQQYTAQQQQPPPAAPQQQQQADSGRATPNYTSNPHTPVNGFPSRPPPPPVAPRAASGTPQPPQAAVVPSPSAHEQSLGQGQVNGHALDEPTPAMHSSTGMGMYNPSNYDMSPRQKRNRRPVACDSCRLRKHKCVIDGDVPPCRNCSMNARSCTFGESTDVLRASTGGGNIGADGKKKLRCDLCKEKKMACSYERDPPCVACKMRGVECTFDVAEAKLMRQSGGMAQIGGMRIPESELPYKPENMQGAMSDGLDLMG